MTNARFDALFGGPPREPESPLTQREMDLASSIQEVTEEVVLAPGADGAQASSTPSICAWPAASRSTASPTARMLREGIFRDIWIQPAAGDAGGALGAALAGWHLYGDGAARGRRRRSDARRVPRARASATTRFSDALDRAGARYRAPAPRPSCSNRSLRALAEGAVVGWFQGRMEFGPRALGSRSILGDARDTRRCSP